MAELASLTALGGVVGDTFGDRLILEVFADGNYAWGHSTAPTVTDPVVVAADAAALAALTGQAEGDVALQADDVSRHIWDGTAWQPLGQPTTPELGSGPADPPDATTVPDLKGWTNEATGRFFARVGDSWVAQS